LKDLTGNLGSKIPIEITRRTNSIRTSRLAIMDNTNSITTGKPSTFKEELIKRVKEVVRPGEGACGICHAVAEEICHAGGRIVAYEQPGGI
jgi:hypothetical protein